MEALLRAARFVAFPSDLIALLILIATILIRLAPSCRSARSTLEHLLNILILHTRAEIILALQKLTLGWVEAAPRRHIIAQSTDRINARWLLLLLLVILLLVWSLCAPIGSTSASASASASVGSSLGREEFCNVLVLHLLALEVLVVALKELSLGRIQTARHPSNGRIADLTDKRYAFGFRLLFLLVVLVFLIILDSTATNGAGIDVGGLNGRHGQARGQSQK